MKWRGRRPCRNIALLSMCVFICTASLIFFFRLMPLAEEPFHVLPDVSIQDFLVNTSGCQIPAWDPWDDSVKVFYKLKGQYKCTGPPSFLRALPNAVVTLDETFLRYYYEINPQNVSCIFQKIIRDTSKVNEKVDSRFKLSQYQKLLFDKPLVVDFIKTSCNISKYSNEKVHAFHEFLPLTPLKTSVEYRATRLRENCVNKPLNVIFLGLDSISHLNYLRHFPKCQKFFSSSSTLFNMKGYTKVGDNTFPNLMPLLTGHFYDHYYSYKNKSMFFDDVDFVWKVFSQLGYRTLLAEDAPDIATFNYYRNGFKKPPTDYYYRPFALAVENSDIKKKSKPQCFGSKMEMHVIYDYLKSFVDTLGTDRPFFAFVFLARLTHDILNFAGYADEPTYLLLKYLEETQVLQNSILVFFSDHGIRYGDIRKTTIGQFEERMPFMNLYLPNWFLKKHPEFERNLNVNSRRLTTPFDIHATLLHIASITGGDQSTEKVSKQGISLFREMSSNRTCSHASITAHYCPCQKIKLISKADFLVQKAAITVIDRVNNLTSGFRDICSLLILKDVLSARLVQGEHGSNIAKNISNVEMSNNYLLTLYASPSDAIFEATVQCDLMKENRCRVIDDISRINEYGEQSICIANAELRKFCYCL